MGIWIGINRMFIFIGIKYIWIFVLLKLMRVKRMFSVSITLYVSVILYVSSVWVLNRLCF